MGKPMATQITVAGGNLYRIAAQVLGDARQWWRLAQANGLTDPILQGVVVLNIPSQNSSLTDGLPPA
jgi:nucleoid-associated protein YgaU